MIVIDVMPPMATSVEAMHRGDNLVDYHHNDSIAYFKALLEGLQKIFIMNHDAVVSFLDGRAMASHHPVERLGGTFS